MATVQIRITSSGKVKKCEEKAARRFAKANPNEYRIIEPPVLEVADLPPVKKKVATVAEDKPKVEDNEVEKRSKEFFEQEKKAIKKTRKPRKSKS